MRPLLAVFTSLVFLCLLPLATIASETELSVFVLQDTPIRSGDELRGVVEQGAIVKAKGVEGVNLSIEEPVLGQISMLHVVPVEEAESFFADRLARNPNDVLMLALRGVMRCGLNKNTEGMNDINAAVQLHAKDGNLHYLRGKAFLASERLVEAQRDFNLAATNTPTARHFVAKGNLDFRLQGKSSNSAMTAFKHAARLDPHYAPAYLGQGILHLANHRIAEAITEFDRVIGETPYLARAHVLKGDALTAKDELDKAITSYSRAMQLDPFSMSALLGRAQARYFNRQRTDADADYDAAEKLAPRTLKDRLDRAQALFKMRRMKPALADIDFVIRRNVDSISARNLRAQILELDGQYSKAIEEVKLLAARLQRTRQPTSAKLSILGYLVSLHIKNKDFAQAERYCEQIGKISNRGTYRLSALARLEIGRGNFDKAIEHYNDLIPAADQDDAQRISGYSGRAMTYERMGEYRKMLDDFQKCAMLDATNAMVNNNLAWIRATCPVAEFRNGTEAVELAQAACGSQKYRSPGSIDTLAAAYAEAGNFEEAVKWQKVAVLLAVGEDVERMKKRVALYEGKQPYREDNREKKNEEDNSPADDADADNPATVEVP